MGKSYMNHLDFVQITAHIKKMVFKPVYLPPGQFLIRYGGGAFIFAFLKNEGIPLSHLSATVNMCQNR